MFSKILSINYSNQLILEMLNASKLAVFVPNFIAPLLVYFILKDDIPSEFLFTWLSFHLMLLIARVTLNSRLISVLKQHKDISQRDLKQYFVITSMSAALYGSISVLCMFYPTTDINLLILSSLIMGLAGGSLVTLGTVYAIFLAFILLSIIPTVMMLIFHANYYATSAFYFMAFLMLVYVIFLAFSGYQFFLSHQKSNELEDKFTTIFHQSSDGIMIIAQNKFIECNETLVKLFGYDMSADDFIKTPLSEVMPYQQPDGQNSLRKMAKVLKASYKKVERLEWLHVNQSGEEFWVEITLRPIVLRQKKVIHGVWRDITDRKNMEAEVIKLTQTLETRIKKEVLKNREKDQYIFQHRRLAQMGEMLSMIAHQWRQPLAAISSTSNAINLKANLNKLDRETSIDLSNKILDYSKHLSLTIDDFRSFYQSNKEKEITSFDQIIKSVLSIMKASIKSKGISLIIETKANDLMQTYPNELKHVLLNLIKNAEDILLGNQIKNPMIKISTYSKQHSSEQVKLILVVKDNGGGVPEEIRDKIFDPYFSTNTNKDGTGLGLYMSKTIVEEHCGGELIQFNDQQGAVFEIALIQPAVPVITQVQLN